MSKNTRLIEESAIAAAIAGFGAGMVPGAAALDTPVVAAIWGNLVVKLAIRKGRTDCTTAVAISVAKGFISYVAGSKILTGIFSLIPGVHFLVAGVNAALNYYYTKGLGEATDRLMTEGARLDDFASLAFHLIPAPSMSELRDIWSDIKMHVA